MTSAIASNNQYNSFQALFKVNAAAGYTLQGNYTYQVVKGDGWGGNGAYSSCMTPARLRQ